MARFIEAVAENNVVTDEDIEALRREAAVAGDFAMVRICNDALWGRAGDRRECENIIREERAHS